MKSKGSVIASEIISDYRKAENYKRILKDRQEKEQKDFIDKNCYNCKNRKTNKCSITRNMKGKLICAFKEV